MTHHHPQVRLPLVDATDFPQESSSTMLLPDLLAELPVGTPQLVATNVKAIQSVVKQNMESPYIIISDVSPGIVERLVEFPHLRVLKASRIFYNADLKQLILKPPSNNHEIASRTFHNILMRQMLNHNMGEEIKPGGAGRVKEGPYSKEPNESLFPSRLIQGRDQKWPILVIEVGHSECIRRLRVEAKWWFGGQVRIVILISVDPAQPRITIEKWESQRPLVHGYTLRAGRSMSPYKSSEVTVTLTTGNYLVTGAPLVLSVDDILLPRSSNAASFVISDRDLEIFSRAVWINQGFLERPE